MFRTLAASLLLVALPALADDGPKVEDLGARLERLDYPYPVTMFPVKSQGQSLEMAYMDLTPEHANGRTAVLLHGKNFCGPYWAATAEHLRAEGYRVVVPDQIGFCKSSRPRGYQYTFQQLATNTHDLLKRLGVDKVTVVAHSMGGMIGARYALMFPQGVERLVLVDPLGLEDWKAKGVPWRSVDAWYASELKTSYASIKAYQLKSYYDGRWKPAYDRWALMQAGMYEGDGREVSSWAGALTYDMIFTQPLVYEFPDIRVPTVLIVGSKDRTAVGKDAAPADVAAKLGDYPALGKEAAARIPGARFVLLDGLGHSPMIEAPERFYEALDGAL
ncbi:Pimeloyl-ACP methyl ester carboxylesterase [Luteibacter sp. UNCMF331Sha3.1]|uniref:alpha/beta fold hydrolase n=1 Tax=Luteibacter sp. UNCMF331Sha3.1 TaxID=1502760 RepID=UPI0008C5F79D|nr:alpha/beta hydrolase [Luteibacter sp. UNCMF331Sha3.1]SEM79214.1 Pimeloyl-ACP methyl ester carboxylesterase [Luteibacter sp. UNCMF331Sha3.1]